MKRGLIVIAALSMLLLAACGSSSKSSGSSDTTTPKARPKVTIDATEYSFKLPATMPSGWVDVTLHNAGKSGHQIGFAKLGTVSYDTFKSAAVAVDPTMAKDVTWVGGPNGVDPGSDITVTVHFEAGEYGVACFIPDDKDGKSHAEHGMVGQVNVATTADSTETAPAVTGGTMKLSEFTFTSDGFTGNGTAAITNTGTQLHEMVVFKEAEGKTFDDVKGFLLTPPGTPPPSGPPPFTSAGGVVALGPGQTNYEAFALAPGKYVLACFFPDTSVPAAQALPHALKGMLKEITITAPSTTPTS